MLKFPAKIQILFVLVLILAAFPAVGFAQDEVPTGPFYVVEEGDSYWAISAKFRVSLDELIAVNGISNINSLAVGTELIIPGLGGVSGRLVTSEVAFGESFTSLSRRYQLSPDDLARLNWLVSPMQLYRGANLILLEEAIVLPAPGRSMLGSGESLLELAVLGNQNPWSLATANLSSQIWEYQSGETLLTHNGVLAGPGGMPDLVSEVQLSPERVEQGSTLDIHLASSEILNLSGKLGDRNLAFYQEERNYIALLGVHALMEPGFYPLNLEGTLPDGDQFFYSQWVYIADAGYPFDPVLIVDPSVVDPAVTEPENEQVRAIVETFTAQKQWQGQFNSPVQPEFSECFPSQFGNRRSYNGSPYDYFHSGLDFCGAVGDDIYAPAVGTVVFSGPLTVRGNTTIIDHGWGVFTIYMHQSEILVNPGDVVQIGQLIGRVGATGRVTGPHLHWEVWAGGVQVDPINWLQNSYP
jgi:murein DD-endopeptidase MepM/ murein hydrolase activator NlpD